MNAPVFRETLDACPNCGSTGILWSAISDTGTEYRVECNMRGDTCATTDYYKKMEDAVKAWNERRFA